MAVIFKVWCHHFWRIQAYSSQLRHNFSCFWWLAWWDNLTHGRFTTPDEVVVRQLRRIPVDVVNDELDFLLLLKRVGHGDLSEAGSGHLNTFFSKTLLECSKLHTVVLFRTLHSKKFEFYSGQTFRAQFGLRLFWMHSVRANSFQWWPPKGWMNTTHMGSLLEKKSRSLEKVKRNIFIC